DLLLQAEDGIRGRNVTGVQTCALPIYISSTVRGELETGTTAIDVLRATFPAGTLSGAPKPRALQIIDELEPVGRGVYGGVVGYMSFTGDLDLPIAIRRGVLRQGTLSV